MTKNKKRKKECVVIMRNFTYVSMDCYGYNAMCSCGKEMFGWTIKDCEEKIKKHLTKAK